jgi:hypothetical protein
MLGFGRLCDREKFWRQIALSCYGFTSTCYSGPLSLVGGGTLSSYLVVRT